MIESLVLSLEKPLLEEVKAVNADYGVAIIGRNEEEGIGNCLQSLLDQSLLPKRIIFINDGSTDKTKEIAESFPNVEVYDFGQKHESWVDSPNLSKVVNIAIEKIAKTKGLNFIITMGGDTILPHNYAKFIINKMLRHPEIVVAGGKVNGEFSHVPRGSARITNLNYWKRIGIGYKTNIGFEGYHIFKAASLGLSYRVFDINTTSTKLTGTRYTKEHWINEGRACKALGYAPVYIIGRSFLMGVRGHPRAGLSLLSGFSSNKSDFYEQELRDYVRNIQIELFKTRRKEIFNRIFKKS